MSNDTHKNAHLLKPIGKIKRPLFEENIRIQCEEWIRRGEISGRIAGIRTGKMINKILED